MSPKYQWHDVTLKDLRRAATDDGRPTREGDFMTQAEAAKAVHVHQTHIANIENGREPASVPLLASLRTLYGVPLEVVYAAYARSRATAKPIRKQAHKSKSSAPKQAPRRNPS